MSEPAPRAYLTAVTMDPRSAWAVLHEVALEDGPAQVDRRSNLARPKTEGAPREVGAASTLLAQIELRERAVGEKTRRPKGQSCRIVPGEGPLRTPRCVYSVRREKEA